MLFLSQYKQLIQPLVVFVFMAFATLPGSSASQQISKSLDCLLTPHKVVKVAIAARGIVKEILVDRGDSINKGQRLASLESGIEKATVKIAHSRANRKAQLESAKKRLQFQERRVKSSRELFRKKHLSARQMDEMETERDVAALRMKDLEEELGVQRLELERAEEILKVRTVLSPIDGVVTERLVSPGEYVDAANLLVVAQTNPLNVEVVAPSSLIGRIRVGMSAIVEPDAPVGGHFRARVVVVDRVVDAASDTFGFRLEMPNPKGLIPAGLRCRVRFEE